jgi:S-DNA-T family DNA segregation ATPase FtsK/SpoIIIE
LNLLLQDYIGKTGTLLILIFGLIIYIIFKIKLSPERIQSFLILPKETQGTPISNPINNSNSGYNLEEFAVAVDDVDEIHLKRMAHNLKLTKH